MSLNCIFLFTFPASKKRTFFRMELSSFLHFISGRNEMMTFQDPFCCHKNTRRFGTCRRGGSECGKIRHGRRPSRVALCDQRK
ncbi:uncharacterized protein BDZ83DRAFT_604584 [Colletotrichum acutatum]|uniref:Uncharacterized protein n=1 Tax=Glomerella acutata TaxID=27357 RepID=A0AAD8XLP8_GLOAC|nr:uncharacterized protein BDZ83DRAFT_604584 [Colletotrichum acutatum]KAK1729666.1 hypothetical protein BDZ83DRAFT_604584 [Colletotrichum acutatum]